MYLPLKCRLIFLLVLEVSDEPLGKLNKEIQLKVFIYYYVLSFEVQAGILLILK